jgi:hypothetical protein
MCECCRATMFIVYMLIVIIIDVPMYVLFYIPISECVCLVFGACCMYICAFVLCGCVGVWRVVCI